MKRWKVGVNKLDCGWIATSYDESGRECSLYGTFDKPVKCKKILGEECSDHSPLIKNELVSFFNMNDCYDYNLEDMVAALLTNDVLFVNSRKYVEEFYNPPKIQEETLVLFLNCNDVFAWACADAEAVSVKDLPELYKYWLKDRKWGTTKWICIKRNEQPQNPIKRYMIEDGSWDESLEALPENHYTKYLRKEAAKSK